MRTLVFSMLAMASMVACTSENDPIKEVEDAPVEIKLTAGVITTKAPIESDEAGLPTAEVTGIQIIQAPEGSTADWDAVSAIASTATMTTQGGINLATQLYYNADDTKKTFLIGYYPMATPASGALAWTITGKEDIIVAPQATGDKTTNKSTPIAFAFEHLLTQLQIEVAGDAAAKAAFGKITGIEVKEVSNNPSLTLSDAATNTLKWGSANGILSVWKGAEGAESDDLTMELPENSTQIGYVMLAPAQSYKLLIKSENIPVGTEKDITIDNLGAVTGSAHKIKLTFKGTNVSATATLTGWKDSTDGGSGEVE